MNYAHKAVTVPREKKSAMRARIAQALEDAAEAGDQVRLCTLRLMTAAIRDRDAALRADEDGSGAVLDDAEIVELLGRMIRQREESVRDYYEAGRMELAEREQREIEIIRAFLPKPMNETEVRCAIAEAINDTGADSIRDIGRVMGRLKKDYAGRMDFGAAGAQVKEALG